jgi:predicted nucleic acid-binding protein
VTLTDAGPLIALIDAGESDHERCRDAVARVALPLLTTWPAFTEAIYLLGQAAGWPGQHALWQMVQRDALIVTELGPELQARCAELMARYRDHPMDLADATLVALAEDRKLHTIFSLDEHFHSYQLRDGRFLSVIPG